MQSGNGLNMVNSFFLKFDAILDWVCRLKSTGFEAHIMLCYGM